jgi:hypothetical protein
VDTPTTPPFQYSPQGSPLIAPPHPSAHPSNLPHPTRTKSPGPGYSHIRHQRPAPAANSQSTSQGSRRTSTPTYAHVAHQDQASGNTNSKSPSKDPSWSDTNDERDRLNDIISGGDSTRANFQSAYKAWDEGRYIDTFFDGYQGISGTMRTLRGAFALISVTLEKAGRQRDAAFFKSAAANINTARRALDLVLSPVSSFRDVATALTDPSSTREQKLSSIANYFGGVGQTIGLAILQLDRRTGDTLLKEFGYAMFTLSETGYAANQVITGYSQAVDALNKGDLSTAGKAVLGATINLVEGPQIVANYIADVLQSLGMKEQAEQMYQVSARLLYAENAIKTVAAVLNPLLDD